MTPRIAQLSRARRHASDPAPLRPTGAAALSALALQALARACAMGLLFPPPGSWDAGSAVAGGERHGGMTRRMSG